VVEERMSSSGCLWHWLVTGRASSLKISATVTHHGMYFSSTPLHHRPFSSLRSTWWDGVKEKDSRGKEVNAGSCGRMNIKPAFVYNNHI